MFWCSDTDLHPNAMFSNFYEIAVHDYLDENIELDVKTYDGGAVELLTVASVSGTEGKILGLSKNDVSVEGWKRVVDKVLRLFLKELVMEKSMQ